MEIYPKLGIERPDVEYIKWIAVITRTETEKEFNIEQHLFKNCT